MPYIEQFSFFGILLTVFAFIHLYWPQAVKRVVDQLSSRLGMDGIGPTYEEQHYYLIGRCYGIAAIVMTVAAVGTMLFQGQ